MKIRSAGLTLVELLIALVIMSLVMAGVIGFYVTHKNGSVSEDLSMTMEQNLRFGMERVTATFRNTGYGAPAANLSSWFPWVSGFTANPRITAGADASTPDTVSIAACTSALAPFATLTANAAAGATSLTLSSTSGLNASNRRLIFIGDQEYALIQSVSGNTVVIDTNPTTGGNQGLSAARLTGTPLCRVDVKTYSVDPSTKTLQLNDNQGAGAQTLIDGVTNFKVTADASGAKTRYSITLTVQTSQRDPATGAYVQRSLASSATARK